MYDLRWRSAVITLFHGQRWILAIPVTAERVVAVNSGSLLRRVDLHGRVYLEQVGQPAHVVTVTMRHNHEIEIPKVDSQRLHIVFENTGIVSSIEQDSLASIFHQGCETPIHGHRRGLAERVIQNGDAVWRLCRSHTGE